MVTRSKKNIKITILSYFLYIIFTGISFWYIVKIVDSSKHKLICLGGYLILTGIWGLVIKVVLFRLPYMSFIYEKDIYVKIVNIAIIIIGISFILYNILI